MTIDRKKSLLEDFKQTLADKFDRNLVEAYAKNFDYDDLDQTFREQLSKEVACEDET